MQSPEVEISQGLESIVAAVAEVCVQDPDVAFAYVFGSTARGDSEQRSDVDVAIYVTEPKNLIETSRFQQQLAEQLHPRQVDLLVLNDTPLWLQFRVIGEGVVAFSRDEPLRVRFRERTEKMYLDFRPVREEYLSSVRDHARAGRLSRG